MSTTSNPLPLARGDATVEGRVASGPHRASYGSWILLETEKGTVLVDIDESNAPPPGSLVRVSGTTSGVAGTSRGIPHRGVLRDAEIEVLEPPSPINLAGAIVRERVLSTLQPYDRGRGLLAGFLIGNVDHVDRVDQEAMRLAGLSHFTAVSGSNVALFLGLLYLLAGPLSLKPRRRAVVGLAGIPVYAAATGFEPSVMRASVMAGLVLLGRLGGLALEPWRVLAVAVAFLSIANPRLSVDVGFQLSVAATAGVLVGARWPVSTSVARALAITIGAQMAVAPLLIVHFGKVPLASPLVNLLAAPLVTVSTLCGSAGALGASWLVNPGGWLAERVLDLAHAVSGWPAVGGTALAGLLACSALGWRWRLLRAPMAIAAAVALVLGSLGAREVADGDVVVLDVGQGDAILLWGGGDRVGLVDGGADPVLLLRRLREYGVTRLDLVVATHGDADHIGGFAGLAGRVRVDEMWAALDHHETIETEHLLMEMRGAGVEVITPQVGTAYWLGSLRVEVLGPSRRYANGNDQSIVLMVEGPDRTMLLTGDIEAVGQADLAGVHADVLKVPHHGSATSSLQWLVDVGSSEAMISVGANDFGHPSPEVVAALEDAGVIVHRTDEEGDLVVGLGR